MGIVSSVDDLLGAETDSLSELKRISGNYVFFRIIASGEELDERFDTLRPAVRRRYTKVKSRELAERKARELAEAAAGVTEAEEFNRLAEEAGVTPEERTSSRWGYLDFGDEMATMVFSATPPELVGPAGTGDTFYLALVTNISPFDEENFRRRESELRLRMLISWMQGQPILLPGRPIGSNFAQLFEAQLSYIVRNAEVQLNREILSSMFGGGSSE